MKPCNLLRRWREFREKAKAARDEAIINAIARIGSKIMLDITTLTSDVDTLQTAVSGVSTTLSNLVTEVADLKTQVANGTGVTQEQLDALDAKIKGGIETLTAAKTAGDAAA